MKRKGIGSHTAPNKGKHQCWLTPPSILSRLGRFDLDPCAAPSPRPWPTAARHIELPEDGLCTNWNGRVWLNPPYDETTRDWMVRMAGHNQGGIALTFARTENEIWQKWIFPFATALLFIKGRLYFCYPDGTAAKGNAGGPSVLIAYSEYDAQVLRDSGIAGGFCTILRR